MQDGGQVQGEGGEQARCRGIAAEADHNVRTNFTIGRAGLHDAGEDREPGPDHAEDVTRPEGAGRQADPSLGGEGLRQGSDALVTGQDDPPAPGDQGFREGLGREQVSACSPGGDNGDLLHGRDLRDSRWLG